MDEGGEDKPRKLFVGGISWQTSEDVLRDHFAKYGEIEEVTLMKDRQTGQPRGFGFVTFSKGVDIDSILDKEHLIDGRCVDVKRAVPRDRAPPPIRGPPGSASAPSAKNGEEKKVFVGGLAASVTREDLRDYFSRFGDVQDAVVMFDRKTNRSKGFGFITFMDEESAKRALQEEHTIHDKPVEVKVAEPKEPRSSSMGMMATPYGMPHHMVAAAAAAMHPRMAMMGYPRGFMGYGRYPMEYGRRSGGEEGGDDRGGGYDDGEGGGGGGGQGQGQGPPLPYGYPPFMGYGRGGYMMPPAMYGMGMYDEESGDPYTMNPYAFGYGYGTGPGQGTSASNVSQRSAASSYSRREETGVGHERESAEDEDRELEEEGGERRGGSGGGNSGTITKGELSGGGPSREGEADRSEDDDVSGDDERPSSINEDHPRYRSSSGGHPRRRSGDDDYDRRRPDGQDDDYDRRPPGDHEDDYERRRESGHDEDYDRRRRDYYEYSGGGGGGGGSGGGHNNGGGGSNGSGYGRMNNSRRADHRFRPY